MTEGYFYDCSKAACQGGVEGIMLELLHGWIHRVHLVLVELILHGGKVQEPVPESTDHPGSHQVPGQNRPHPTPGELPSRAKGWVLLTCETRQVVNAQEG